MEFSKPVIKVDGEMTFAHRVTKTSLGKQKNNNNNNNNDR